MQTNTKKIMYAAMLCAIAYVMVAICRIPVVLFLKYDPKDVIIALGGLIWGPGMSLIVSVIVSILEMFTISDTGIWGCVMNIISTCSFACTAAIIYKRNRTIKGAVMGLLLGCLAMVGIVMLWDYLVVPIYMGYPRAAVADLLVPAFLPFNLIKGFLNAVFTFLLYKPIVTALRKVGIVEASESRPAGRPVAIWAVCGVILVSCVVSIVLLRG